MARLPKIEKPEEATRVSKKEFVDMIREKTGIKKEFVSAMYDAFEECFREFMLEDKIWEVRRMGSFFLKPSTRREVRNMYGAPERIVITPPKYKLRFEPHKSFFWEINQKSKKANPDEWALFVEESKAARADGREKRLKEKLEKQQ